MDIKEPDLELSKCSGGRKLSVVWRDNMKARSQDLLGHCKQQVGEEEYQTMELMVVFPGPGSWRGVDWQEVNFHVWGNCSKGIQWGGDI